MRQKLEKLIIPQIEFREASIVDVLNYLSNISVAVDTEEKTGVNIVLAGNIGDVPSITLSLRRVSMLDAIKFTTDIANLSYRIDKDAILIMSRTGK